MRQAKIRSSFIDLFSGCGGLSLGLMKSGWRGLFAVEQSPLAFKTLEHNLIDKNEHNTTRPHFDWPDWLEKKPFEIKAFVRTHREKLMGLRGNIQLVAGGPPCQGFSFAGKRTGDDPRNELFKYHLEIVEILRPELVLLENVQGIETAFGAGKGRKGEHRKSYAKKIRDMLEAHDYEVQQDVLKALDFGVPQVRPRYFTVGIRRDLLCYEEAPNLFSLLNNNRTEFLKQRGLPTNRPVTVMEAISDLAVTLKHFVECKDEESPPGFKEIIYEGPKTHYQRLMHEGMINGKPLNSIRLANHRPETIHKFQKILDTCRKGVQLSPADKLRLGIKKNAITPLSPHQPSHTITTLPDDLLHYDEPRIHTVREHARLQSFPDWFEFRGKYTTGGNMRTIECPRYTQVGNAVPPLLSEAIGDGLLYILQELIARSVSITFSELTNNSFA